MFRDIRQYGMEKKWWCMKLLVTRAWSGQRVCFMSMGDIHVDLFGQLICHLFCWSDVFKLCIATDLCPQVFTKAIRVPKKCYPG